MVLLTPFLPPKQSSNHVFLEQQLAELLMWGVGEQQAQCILRSKESVFLFFSPQTHTKLTLQVVDEEQSEGVSGYACVCVCGVGVGGCVNLH